MSIRVTEKRIIQKYLGYFLLACMVLLLSVSRSLAAEDSLPSVSVLHVTLNGGISPAQVDLINGAIEHASAYNYKVIVIQIDTPGGLVSSMREINKAILGSTVPIAVWVGPSGARATSAGVFLVAASSFAGMAPQTTIGAASPVNADGSDVDATMKNKVTNDLASYAITLANRYNRNADWYEKAVRRSVSLPGDEAVVDRVVEVLATSLHDFLVQAGSRGIPLPSSESQVAVAGSDSSDTRLRFAPDRFTIVPYEAGFRYSVLQWLLDPQIAYLLFLAGIGCLFIEFTHPGAIVPGVVGALALLLGLYAMSLLPTDIAGLLLIVVSLVLFGLEVKVVSHGLLFAAGVVALFFGSLILFPEQGGELTLPISTIIAATATLSGGMVLIITAVIRASRQVVTMSMATLVGRSAKVKSWDGFAGYVLLDGILWKAVCSQAAQQFSHLSETVLENVVFEKGNDTVLPEVDYCTMSVGDTVIVTHQTGNVLQVISTSTER